MLGTSASISISLLMEIGTSRPGLRRGRRADGGAHLGSEARGEHFAQRDRPRLALLLRGQGQARFLIFGDHVALSDEEIRDLGAFLVDADLRFASAGTTKPVTRTMSEKQAFVAFVTMTRA